MHNEELRVGSKKTGFYQKHVQHGAKIVEFAGYLMPIQYAGIIQEHRRVRTSVGLFDVSHMGEFFVGGDTALQYLQKVTINDVSKLSINQVQYSAMCYQDGGIVDDLLIYKFSDHYIVVVNAANLQKDWKWMNDNLIQGTRIKDISDDTSLLALQGPKSIDTLQKLTNVKLDQLNYYWMTSGTVSGVNMIISRTGYTGEPGFELCFQRDSSEQIWDVLMQAGKEFDIEPVGLGARDTLRLEMKYCLYGNDIDETTNPLEAGLGWITRLEKDNFIGKPAIEKVKRDGLTRKLVGFELEGKAFPRHGYSIFGNGQEIGHVTSGTFSPMLEKGIGVGYVNIDYSKVDTRIEVNIRGKHIPGVIVKTPFYKKA